MKRRTLQSVALVLLGTAALALAASAKARAQSTIGNRLVLWVDTRTGQVFVRPGPHRTRLVAPGTITEDQLQREVDKKVDEKTAAIQQQLERQQTVNTSLAEQNASLTKQVAEIKPAWKNFTEGFASKIYIGTLMYGDYALYTHTSFGPQFLTQTNQPGPGNNIYNAFDITRTYINFLFKPTKDWTVRLTPNLYRTIGSSNDKFGHQGAIGSDLDGNMGVRIKYAYLDYNGLWDRVPALKGGHVRFGYQANPLIAWEEDLYGYRYVNLVPWNYYSLSSTQAGLGFRGPIKSGEKTYVDYDFGVYNNASFHAFEQSNTKEAMGRMTVYPFGALWRYDGLGLTGFYNYGYGNTTPDNADLPNALKGGQSHITRIAALLAYTAETWQLAGEFDWGHNSFSTGNLFSGSGPGDAFGFPTCTTVPSGGSCTGPTVVNPGYADFTTLAQALLNNGRTTQQGFAFFGHYHIPTTPLTVFGMFNWWQPNTQVDVNPFDFQRWVLGVSYQYNEYLRFALDSQNAQYYHSQFNFPTAEALQFNSASKYSAFSTSSIHDVVPRDIHAFFLNVEFSY
jgi:hypothetical protein